MGRDHDDAVARTNGDEEGNDLTKRNTPQQQLTREWLFTDEDYQSVHYTAQ
jgi:hypothetical protein